MLSAIGKGLAILVGLIICAGIYLYVLSPQTAVELAQALERGRAGLTEHQVQVGEFNIHYLSGGEGETLLLLHGFGADKDNWTRIAADLTPQYRVIAPDLPGFGVSDHPQGVDYRAATQAQRVHDFVQKLDLGKVHIAGNSMGGAIAGAYAAAYPDETRSLWLLAPAAVVSAPVSELRARIGAGKKNPLLPSTHEEYYALLGFVFEEEPFIPAPLKFVLAERAIERNPLLTDIFFQISSDDLALEQALASSPVPTLILWGKQDRLLHVGGAAILNNAIPSSKMVIMDETGHAPMIERPHQSAEAFKAFQQNLPARVDKAPVAQEAEETQP